MDGWILLQFFENCRTMKRREGQNVVKKQSQATLINYLLRSEAKITTLPGIHALRQKPWSGGKGQNLGKKTIPDSSIVCWEITYEAKITTLPGIHGLRQKPWSEGKGQKPWSEGKGQNVGKKAIPRSLCRSKVFVASNAKSSPAQNVGK